ncbi:DUF7535 family protein [Haloarcula pelagica]|uniref:DUF7535 family protein n=1 Tax=Haloarcula pelagica TaxID=3033389 RepID=UPI0024C26825|nr:hypothetical protein [Halomicroarcula sp. YJ-61-S]
MADDTPTDSESTGSLLPEPLRTVTPLTGNRPDQEMDIFGWGMFLTIVILLVPLLPFIVIVWLISKVTESLAPN